ncbi:MAG: hypothetical protein ACI8Y4_004536 [Candidatus Poriferisodalaceae bacterium]|jgi:hypothetical protein
MGNTTSVGTTLIAELRRPGVDLDLLPLTELANSVISQAAIAAAETAEFLRLLAVFDRRGGWAGDGIVSCVHWMRNHLSTERSVAYEQLRVAHALEGLPALSESFGNGELSYSRIRAVTRVAVFETEETWLEWAKYSTGAQLETLVRDVRRIDDLSKPTPPPAPPKLARGEAKGGRVVFSLSVDVADAELVWKAVGHAVTADTERPIAERRADAFVAIADAYMAGVPADRSGSDRTQVVLHTEPGNPEGSLSDGTRVDVATRQRLECDASRITCGFDENGEEVPGRRTAGVPERLRRQLLFRDRSCRWPGCGNEHYLHAHHIIHRGHGGPTAPENLILLCGHHHRVLHRHRYSITRNSDASWTFYRPDGSVIDATPATMSLPRKTRHCDDLPPGTIDSKWAGERLDRSQTPQLPVKPRPSEVDESSAED